MRRISKCIVMAAAAAALLLALLPFPSIAAEETYEAVDVKVSIDAGSDTVSVQMTIVADTDWFTVVPVSPTHAGPEVILPEGYFNDFEATGTAGNQLEVVREDNHWRINGGGQVVLSYSVNLGTLEDLSPAQTGVNDPAISPFYPHYDAGYMFLPGYSLFLLPDLAINESEVIRYPSGFNLTFELPEGWEVYLPWDGNQSAWLMLDSAVYAGAASAIEADGDIPLDVVQEQGADPANLAAQQEFANNLAAQLAAADEAWGKPGITGGRLAVFLGALTVDDVGNQDLLSIPLDPLYACAFVPAGTRENILATDFLLRAGDESLRVFLGSLDASDEALWFREGCIHYSNLRFARRNQWISEDGVFDRLGAAYASYVDTLAQSGTSLASAGEQALQAPAAALLNSGGTIAVTAIDVKLAAAGKSLDGFITGLLADPPSGGTAITNQYLQEQLEAYSGVSFDSFFENYITGAETIPASSFSELKLDRESAAESGTEIPDVPAPGFGNRWILIVVAIGIVFALPFVLEPYTLKPRAGAVPVSGEEEEAERNKARRGRWWSWDEDEEDGDEEDGGEDEDGAVEDEDGEEPEPDRKPENYPEGY